MNHSMFHSMYHIFCHTCEPYNMRKSYACFPHNMNHTMKRLYNHCMIHRMTFPERYMLQSVLCLIIAFIDHTLIVCTTHSIKQYFARFL